MYVRDETDPWNIPPPPLSTSRFVTHLAWVCNYSHLLTNREGAKYTYLTKKLEYIRVYQGGICRDGLAL